jgi:hypothetical protein
MRLARMIGVLTALVLALTMSTGLVGPSQAAGKPKHVVVAKGRIKILRNVSGGSYRVYKKTRTRSTGRFKTRIFQAGNKKTCFKVQVPATATYRKTTTPNLGCITTTR